MHVAPRRKLPGDDLESAIVLVVAHVRTHSSAADTLTGIAQWWLGPGGESIPMETLRLALDHLVDRGVLATRLLPNGELLWHVSAGFPDRGFQYS